MEEEIEEYQLTKDDVHFIKNFHFVESSDHIFIREYIGKDKKIVIPNTFKDKPITFVDRKFFSNEHSKNCEELVIGDNVISFYTPLKENMNIKTVTFGERLNCVESLLNGSAVTNVIVNKNPKYKIYKGCLLSTDGTNLLWNDPWVKKVPSGVKAIGFACQFYDSVYLPDTIESLHVNTIKTKHMVIYFGGREIEWNNVKIVKTLTPKDIKKKIFDNEIQGKSINHKFRKVRKRISFDVKFQYVDK